MTLMGYGMAVGMVMGFLIANHHALPAFIIAVVAGFVGSGLITEWGAK